METYSTTSSNNQEYNPKIIIPGRDPKNRIPGSYPDIPTKEKADNILKEFQGMAQTKENFKALGEKYTADSKVLYYNVKSGEMTTEFNDWIFDEERKEGDTDVVKTTYGYHVMFFLGDGVQQWELTALENSDKDGMLDKDFSAWKEEIVAKYPVTTNEKAIAKFDESIGIN